MEKGGDKENVASFGFSLKATGRTPNFKVKD